ncbi:MAG: protein kinase [Alphaproteobacteria bacterium]|nr:protein kinase [Alphaproteobacteria bacterium]
MGLVYRATHTTQRVPVAVKVDLHPPAPESTAAFLHEVQIVAALDHPNVVMVLDHGVVTEAAQRDSQGELREGARWLAMELAGGGTAADHAPATWPEVRHLTQGLLKGLAHAHARGVVHRDIKPGNLLLAGDEASVATVPKGLLDARVVLSDFGISERREFTALRTEDSVGTPQFMAPEQIEGRWRDQGPWTDLYAVGVLVWYWLTGRYPFRGTTAFKVFKQHLYDAPPAFEPTMDVPAGVEALLRELLAKDPTDRPEFAVEVRRSIDGLGEATVAASAAALPDDFEAETETRPGVAVTTGRTYGARTRGRLAKHGLVEDGRHQNVQLHGAGLALFGLRTVPFVGREAECDALWKELVQVRTERSARAVILRGPSGIGKSRLADWLCCRVHEVGVASTIRAEHREGDPPGAGIVRLLEHELRTDGLDPIELQERIGATFPDPPFDRAALAALLAPQHYDRPPPTTAEARQLALAVLMTLAKNRTYVLVLEDAHRDVTTLELVDQILAVQQLTSRPLLILATVQDEELVATPECEELIGDLLIDPAAQSLVLQALDGEARQRLVRSMLGLEGALAQRIEDQTAGNPLFASQLLGSWVDQGILVPGPRGFQLAEGRTAEIPRDLTDIWRARVEAALSGQSGEAIEAMEVAAALGMDFSADMWSEVCHLLELPMPERLLATWLNRHLLHLDESEDRQIHFAHGLIRQALVDRSRFDGHWRDHNLAVAVHLREEVEAVKAVRLAGHLLEAEVWDEAVDPLAGAIEDQIDSGDLRSADLLDRLEDVLRRLELPESNDWWGRLLVLRASRHRLRGELEEAEQKAEDAVYAAQRHGWKLMAARALRESARVLFARAAFGRALTRATEAEQAFLALGDRLRAADCGYTIAEIQSATGQLDEAQQRFLQVIAVFEKQGREFLHNPLLGMVQLQHRRGDRAATAEWLERCRDHAQPLGLQWVLANCANIEGELARAAGDNEAASSAYREAAERYRAIESPDFAFPLLNLGILDVAGGAHDVAVQRMQPLILHCRRRPNALVEGFVHMVLMVSHAGLGDRDAAAESLNRLVSYVGQSSLVDPDVAEMAERAGMLMRKAGWEPEAGRALRLADTQYRSCGRADDAARVRQSL